MELTIYDLEKLARMIYDQKLTESLRSARSKPAPASNPEASCEAIGRCTRRTGAAHETVC